MDESSLKIFLDLRVQLRVFHQVGGIHLKDRPDTDQPTVAFQVALLPVRTHLLKVRPVGVTRELDKPVLKGCPFLLVKSGFEVQDIKALLYCVHGRSIQNPSKSYGTVRTGSSATRVRCGVSSV